MRTRTPRWTSAQAGKPRPYVIYRIWEYDVGDPWVALTGS